MYRVVFRQEDKIKRSLFRVVILKNVLNGPRLTGVSCGGSGNRRSGFLNNDKRFFINDKQEGPERRLRVDSAEKVGVRRCIERNALTDTQQTGAKRS